MKKLLCLIALLIVAASFTSCSKEVITPAQIQTKVVVAWRYGSDNMLYGSAMYCYPGDTKRTLDTVLYFNTNTPDTSALYHDAITRTPTGTVDSAFMYAGQFVRLVGPIYHREYNGAVGHIKSITYGTINHN